MTGDGQSGDAGGGTHDPGSGELPPELRDLDRELRSIRFDPRPGLESDVLASVTRKRAPAAEIPGSGRSLGRRTALRAAAMLALVAAVGLLVRAAPTGDGEGTPARIASSVDRPESAPERWAIRWGTDARVLSLGPGAIAARPSDGRTLRCRRIGDRLRCRGTRPGPARFAAARGPAVLRDFCCLDYDGGGPADDGVRVVAGQREAVVSFWIYEDRDHDGTFSDGDLIRTVLDGGPADEDAAPSVRGIRRLDRCCADLDGGPHSDDGVFVLAGAGERVALAVLYEDVTGDRRLSPGDRLRGLRAAPLGTWAGAGPR